MESDIKRSMNEYNTTKEKIIEKYGPTNMDTGEIIKEMEILYNKCYYIIRKENLKACPLVMKFMKEIIAMEKIKPERES